MAGRHVNRCDVGRSALDRHRIGERHLLPTRRCLGGEGGRAEQCPVGAPDVRDVGTDVGRCLVEPCRRDVTVVGGGNRTPTSTADPSPESMSVGVSPTGQIEHGAARGPAVSARLAGDSMLHESSMARTRTVRVPDAVGVKAMLHEPVPVARRQVVPPSVDTSTAATSPPPLSTVTPVTTTGEPMGTVVAGAGAVKVVEGGTVSVDCAAGARLP